MTTMQLRSVVLVIFPSMLKEQVLIQIYEQVVLAAAGASPAGGAGGGGGPNPGFFMGVSDGLLF